MDTVIREVLVAGSTVQYASTSASRGNVGSGMLLNSAEIREIVRTLKLWGATVRTVVENVVNSVDTLCLALWGTDGQYRAKPFAGKV